MISVEESEKRYKEAREIKCPHCGTVQENDDMQYPVTYWGEPSTSEFQCQNGDCEKIFFVRENVIRTYDCGKTEEELEL